MDCKHDWCSFQVLREHQKHLKLVNRLGWRDKIVYGTSDSTINPAEMWFTSEVARRMVGSRTWQFFNYPLSANWLKLDLEGIFYPYQFNHADNPAAGVDEMGLERGVVRKLVFASFQDMLANSDMLATMPIGDLVTLIRKFRRIPTFVVSNILNSGNQQPVYASSKNRIYKKQFRFSSFGKLLRNPNVKFGGTLIYFLYGYYIAKEGVVGLIPHKPKGDVWGAVAAVASLAGSKARLYKVGELDLMTNLQWDLYQQDQRWRKAPPWVIAKLISNPFCSTLRRELINNRRYCAVSYDVATNSFRFV